MTESIQPRTYRTRSGRLLTDADIERIAEEIAATDLDLTRARILYPPEPSQPATRPVPAEPQNAGIRGLFPQLAGFWDDPSETVVDPAALDASSRASIRS